MTNRTLTKPAHRYVTVGHTIADPAKRRDCTAVYQTVEFSAHTGRIRVEHSTCWQGSRRRTWYFDGQTLADAAGLLNRIVADGVECLGDSDRQSAVIR